MASKKTLNAKNLEALGAARLAELLIELSSGDAAAKRRLRLELAGALGPAEVARDVRKRLSTIARSRSYVDWDKTGALARDLDVQRDAIVEKIAPSDPGEALDLMWRFMALADSINDRCDDSDGRIGDVFHSALADLARIAVAARPDPNALAERVCAAIQDNACGQYDGLIALLSPVLGKNGLQRLESHVRKLAEEPVPIPPEDEWEAVAWGGAGPIYAHEMAERERLSTVRHARMDIADARGDVDTFIGQFDREARKVPKVAAEIAERLLAAGRAEEALKFIEGAEFSARGWVPVEWQTIRLDVLEALGRGEEAQAFRLDCFQRTLASDHLRAYLKRLPDFEDMEAEETALAHAADYPYALSALDFLIRWPALERASRLVTTRTKELDGDHYAILSPAAEALAEQYPLAATLVLRAMIDFSLGAARTTRYRHAARHLVECGRLAGRIEDFGDFETHVYYVAKLKSVHGRKASFWQHVV